MHAQTQTRRIETVHCLILGLSTFLVGLYFGTSIPAGVDLVALQTGLIGVLGFLALTQIRIVAEPADQAAADSGVLRSKQVERRLDRHIAPRIMYRIDRANRGRGPFSVRKNSRTTGAVSAVAESSSTANQG